jgi:hypothetical protein
VRTREIGGLGGTGIEADVKTQWLYQYPDCHELSDENLWGVRVRDGVSDAVSALPAFSSYAG